MCHGAGDAQHVEGFARVLFAHNDHASATVQNARDFRGTSQLT